MRRLDRWKGFDARLVDDDWRRVTTGHDFGMTIEDPLLPAAAYLTGPHAVDVLRPVIERADGDLRGLTGAGLQYRPGRDLVVRYRADVSWRGGQSRRETLLAATTMEGPPPGTLRVVADTEHGELAVGVWRWPFDPFLPALESVVRTSGVREILVAADLVSPGAAIELTVRTYRPTDRVVVKVISGGNTWYLKLLHPDRAETVAARHRSSIEAGLPVPAVVASDVAAGWVLLDEVPGPTLRDLIKSDASRWLPVEQYRELVRKISSSSDGGLAVTRSRLKDAPAHTELLARVLPSGREQLARLEERFRVELAALPQRDRGVVHGDLHEGQLIVEGGRITGLLDIDDMGIGDLVDDVAVMIGHLRYRAGTSSNTARIDAFADDLVTAHAADHSERDVAVGTAAVLIGIAGSRFLSQHEEWERSVADTLDLVERLLQ